MYKFLIAAGLIDLTFQFPRVTALTVIGFYLYNNTTLEDKQQLATLFKQAKVLFTQIADKVNALIPSKETVIEAPAEPKKVEASINTYYQNATQNKTFDDELEIKALINRHHLDFDFDRSLTPEYIAELKELVSDIDVFGDQDLADKSKLVTFVKNLESYST